MQHALNALAINQPHEYADMDGCGRFFKITVRKSIFLLTTKIYTVKITQNKGKISP